MEVLATPLTPYVVEDWLATLCERQVGIERYVTRSLCRCVLTSRSVLDGVQRRAYAAAGVASPAPPHDEITLAVALRGVRLMAVQSGTLLSLVAHRSLSFSQRVCSTRRANVTYTVDH